MCIGLWSLDHPDYALIVCTNRDEYLSRPTVNAHFHSFGTGSECNGKFVLSGRDLQAGGSWFGINRAGRVALLTNISEHGASYKESRGHLVSSFLLPDAPDREQFVKLLAEDEASDEYAGFNLLLLSPLSGNGAGSLAYEASLITNSGGGGSITSRALVAEERRSGGVSNGIDNLDGRSWPKVQKGEARLREVLYEKQYKAGSLSDSEDSLAEQLFEILLFQPEQSPANRFQLRTSIQIPPLRMSPSLSPGAESSDRHGLYGTRLSTVLLVRRDGCAVFIERDMWKLDAEGNAIRGDPREARVFRFMLNGFNENKDDL